MARGNIRFTPGLLTQLGSFGQGPANQQGAAGASMLPPAQQFGPSGLGGMFARNLGGLLGMDMRTPGEKLQQELKQVKDPLSPEGLLQRAQIISANSTDPKSLQVAAALAAEGKRLQTAKTTKERAAQARTSSAEWLKNNAPELLDLHDNFALTDEAVAKMAQAQQVADAARRLEKGTKGSARRGKIAVVKTFNLPEEEETKLINQVNNGDFDEQSVQDLEDNFDIPLAEATIKNYIVYNDKEDPSKGTKRIGLRTDKYGRVHNGTEYVSLRQAGVKEVAGVGKEATEPEAPTTKQAFMAQAQGATLNIARQLGGLSEAEKIAVLGAADTPARTALLVQGNENLGQKAGQVANSTRRIVQAVARELSGAAIKIDEQEDFRQLLVPTLADFGDNNLIFTKLANNYVGFAVANQSGYVRNTRDEAQGEVNVSILKDALADLSALPITPEIQKLVDEGRFEEALELRKNQLLGGEQGEISIESIKAKYGQ